jgi:hypothetical protein
MALVSLLSRDKVRPVSQSSLIHLVLLFAWAFTCLYVLARKRPSAFRLYFRLAAWAGLLYFFVAILSDPDWNRVSVSGPTAFLLSSLRQVLVGVSVGFFLVHMIEARYRAAPKI